MKTIIDNDACNDDHDISDRGDIAGDTYNDSVFLQR